jgi:hypothetical protein
VGAVPAPSALRLRYAPSLPRIASRTTSLARSRSEKHDGIFSLFSLFSLSPASCDSTTFAEGDAGEARGVAQRSREGAAGPN